jgi:hypothetical protein
MSRQAYLDCSNGDMAAMRCLSPTEAVGLFGHAGFSVTSNPLLERTAFVLNPAIASRQTRVGGRPTQDVSSLPDFVEALIRWYPPRVHRMLWIDQWNRDFPSACELFLAARIGLGETRSLSEAPGHCFDRYPYDERDQTRISHEQARETGILVGLTSLVMINGWDAWLIAGDGSDRIEFWEGNIFFYSSETSRLNAARSIMDQFNCPQDLN